MPKLSNFLLKRLTPIIEESSKQHYNFLLFCIDNNIDVAKLDLSSFEKYMEYMNMYMRCDYDNIH